MEGSVTLTGPRCSGKSEAGEKLADILGFSYIDLDREFKKSHGPIDKFVEAKGWEEFRKHESSLYRGVCHEYQFIRTIVSGGGGLFVHNQGEEYRLSNVEKGQAFGDIFYLIPADDVKESELILASRLPKDSKSADSRPSLTKGESDLKAMFDLERRGPIYLGVATKVIRTEQIGGVEKVAEHMAGLVRANLK